MIEKFLEMSPDMMDFLRDNPRLPIVEDMPMLLNNITTRRIIARLLFIYAKTPQDGSLPLKYYSTRNIDAIRYYIENYVDPNVDYGLTDQDAEILDIFASGNTPDVSQYEVETALGKIDLDLMTKIMLPQPNGEMKLHAVIYFDSYGADERIQNMLLNKFEENGIDAGNFNWSDWMKVIMPEFNIIDDPNLYNMDHDDRKVYNDFIPHYRGELILIKLRVKRKEIGEQELGHLLVGDIIGDGLLESMELAKHEISDEPIGEALLNRIALYQDEVKPIVYNIYDSF